MSCSNGHEKVVCYHEPLYKFRPCKKLESCFSNCAYNCCIPCLELHLRCINKLYTYDIPITPRESTLTLAIECVILAKSKIPIEQRFKVVKYIVRLGGVPSYISMSYEYNLKQLKWLMRRGLCIDQDNVFHYVKLCKFKHIEQIKDISVEQNNEYIVYLCDIILYLRNLLKIDCIMTIFIQYLNWLDLRYIDC